MKLRNISFSPPDMSEAEISEVAEALRSGWITTGPKTKEFERLISAYLGTRKVVCLNSGTAAMEMVLRLIGVGPEDEVIVPAYTYTATASVTQHVGCKVVMVDSQKDKVEMDYDKLAEAITERTKVICPVDLGGVMCDYDRIFEIVEAKRDLFCPANAIQKKIGRIVVAADDAHAFGAWKIVTQKSQKSQKSLMDDRDNLTQKAQKSQMPQMDDGDNLTQKAQISQISQKGDWDNLTQKAQKSQISQMDDRDNLTQKAQISQMPLMDDGDYLTQKSQKGQETQKRMAGAIADFSSFSFHAVKNLTTAEGGALTWNLPFGTENVDVNDNLNFDYFPTVSKMEGETWDELLYRLTQLLSLHGQNKDALAKTQMGAWEYDVIGPWYKCNMTDVMAGIGLAQLRRYPEMLDRRRQIIGRYNAAIDDLNADLDDNHQVKYLDHYGEDYSSSGHLYITRLTGRSDEERREVIVKMAERGIVCNVHYKPLPMMTAYKALGFDIKDYPNAYHLYENEVTLPLHTKLTDEDVEYVIGNYVDIIKNM